MERPKKPWVYSPEIWGVDVEEGEDKSSVEFVLLGIDFFEEFCEIWILSAKTAAILYFFSQGEQVKYLYSAMGTWSFEFEYTVCWIRQTQPYKSWGADYENTARKRKKGQI